MLENLVDKFRGLEKIRCCRAMWKEVESLVLGGFCDFGTIFSSQRIGVSLVWHKEPSDDEAREGCSRCT
jgi:hypothetical protein